MAKQTIALGAAPNDGTGTNLRAAGDMINDNFDELYPVLTGRLLAASNLSDVASPITARANLDVDGAWCHPGFVTLRWYSAVPSDRLGVGIALNSGRSYWIPIFIPEAVTITDLAGRVITAGAAGNFGLAIYAMNSSTKYPSGAALASATGLSTGSGNTAVSATLGAPVAFARGWYWAAGMADNATATFTSVMAAGAEFPHLIGDTSLANLADAVASQRSGLQNTVINYASGFTNATTAIASFSVAANSNIAPYFKAQ